MSIRRSPASPSAKSAMYEPPASPGPAVPDWPAEVARLTKIIRALMDRAERSTSVQGSDFSLFQTAVMLEQEVRTRTAELEAAVRENEKITRALRESEAKFRGVVSQSLVGIVLIEDGKFSYSNARFDEIFGYAASEVREIGPLDVVSESDRARVAESIRKRVSGEADHVQFEFRGLRKDGAIVDIEAHGSRMDVGGQPLLITLLLDITERTRTQRELDALQEKLREQSTRDALTGLYNRRYLDDTLTRELSLAERTGQPVSVILADLDHFKAVNDRAGHGAGDAALRIFGDLLKRSARVSDIYCRYGGEEFLLVLPGLAAQRAVDRAEQLRRTIAATPVDYDGTEILVTASFGVAAFPAHGRTGDELIAAADIALYAAKARGRNRVIVSSGLINARATAPRGEESTSSRTGRNESSRRSQVRPAT
jgi:diguanylate cyclase (GGDEF)-like protein/PAS domain S-box-containing protein